MRLQLARCLTAPLEGRLVLDSQIDTPEDGAGHTKPRLKVPVIVDGKQPANTELVYQNDVHTGRKVAALVTTALHGEAKIEPSSGDALGARTLAHHHEHIDVRLHHSRNVCAVVLGQQGGGGQSSCSSTSILRAGPQTNGPRVTRVGNGKEQ